MSKGITVKKNEKLKVILLTVAVVLTVEIFIVAVLRGFGLVHASFGRESDNMTQTGNANAAVSDLSGTASDVYCLASRTPSMRRMASE